jgi:hypothetical protein
MNTGSNLLLAANFKQGTSIKVNLPIWEMMMPQDFETSDFEDMKAPSHC